MSDRQQIRAKAREAIHDVFVEFDEDGRTSFEEAVADAVTVAVLREVRGAIWMLHTRFGGMKLAIEHLDALLREADPPVGETRTIGDHYGAGWVAGKHSSVSTCRHCGEFRGHGHECGAASPTLSGPPAGETRTCPYCNEPCAQPWCGRCERVLPVASPTLSEPEREICLHCKQIIGSANGTVCDMCAHQLGICNGCSACQPAAPVSPAAQRVCMVTGLKCDCPPFGQGPCRLEDVPTHRPVPAAQPEEQYGKEEGLQFDRGRSGGATRGDSSHGISEGQSSLVVRSGVERDSRHASGGVGQCGQVDDVGAVLREEAGEVAPLPVRQRIEQAFDAEWGRKLDDATSSIHAAAREALIILREKNAEIRQHELEGLRNTSFLYGLDAADSEIDELLSSLTDQETTR